MADWSGLRNYIHGKYKVSDDKIDSLSLLFETDGGRSQRVIVHDAGNGWATLWTPVCAEGDINPRDALLRNTEMRIGALALIEGGPVIFKHSFPLANLDAAEFEEPLHMVINYGDKLEAELSGGDRF